MTKILVVGAGSIGKRHIRNLLKHGLTSDQLGVVEPRADRRSEVTELGVAADRVYASRKEAVAQDSFDGAIIATPTAFHYDDAIELARAGVHLMIEKPIGVDLSRYDELYQAITSNNLFAFTAYCFRFDPVAQKFAESLHANIVGKPLYARADMSTYLPDWHPWEDYRHFYMASRELGGGTLLDQSHLYDMTVWFFGDIKGLIGISTKCSDLEINTDDYGEMIFQMEQGFYVSVHIDLFTKVARRFYQVTGDDGTIEWDINNRRVLLTRPGSEAPEILIQGPDYNLMYERELEYFLKGVAEGPGIEGPSILDGKKAMDVVCAVRESQGRSFIELPHT